MGHQGEVYLLHLLIAASLKGGDEDHVGVHAHDHLAVEVAFDTNLGGFARLDPFVHLLVEKMTCAGDARHEVACVQGDEVRELERGHAHAALDRCLDGCVSLWQSDGFCSSRDQSELIDRAFRLLWILDIDQAYTAFDILHFESFRILGGDVARCVSTCSVCPFRRDVARYVSISISTMLFTSR